MEVSCNFMNNSSVLEIYIQQNMFNNGNYIINSQWKMLVYEGCQRL